MCMMQRCPLVHLHDVFLDPEAAEVVMIGESISAFTSSIFLLTIVALIISLEAAGVAVEAAAAAAAAEALEAGTGTFLGYLETFFFEVEREFL